MSIRIMPAGAEALLVELDDLPQTLGLLATLRAAPIEGLREIVPGARTLLLEFDPLRITGTALAEALRGLRFDTGTAAGGELVEIPVHYDGEDLAEVAALLGITAAEVVARHTGSDWFVAFTGFAPGFAYLSGGDELLRTLPRRATPRTRIPPGAVAVAGGFSGVYPKASPGGWQLLGQTFVPMWDLARDPPALLQPGQRVRFVDVGPRPLVEQDLAPSVSQPIETTLPAIEVVRPGPQSLLQDLGRPGRAGQGVAASGAMDRGSLRAANRLVGNPADSACIEAALGGLELLSRGDSVLAITGAAGSLTLIAADGHRWPVPRYAPLALSDGDRLLLGEPTEGVRSYVAVRGGFASAPVLGSLSFDTLAGVGPAPLAAGDRLALGTTHRGLVGDAVEATPAWPTAGDTVVLDVHLGPRDDWFTRDAIELLASQPWAVTPQSNRVGLRVQGERPLARTVAAELPSEGTPLGAIQVPASGQPVLFLADHPLTGGYPVIACIARHHLGLAGQVPVGALIRFNIIETP